MKAKSEMTDGNRRSRTLGSIDVNPFLANTDEYPNAPSRITNVSVSSFRKPDFSGPSFQPASRKLRRQLFTPESAPHHAIERPQPIKCSVDHFQSDWSSPLSSPVLHEVEKSSSSSDRHRYRQASRGGMDELSYRLCSELGILALQNTPSPRSRTAPVPIKRAISMRDKAPVSSSPSLESKASDAGIILVPPTRSFSMNSTFKFKDAASSSATLVEPPILPLGSPIAVDHHIDNSAVDMEMSPQNGRINPSKNKKKRRLSLSSCSPEPKPEDRVNSGSPVPPHQRHSSGGGRAGKKLKLKVTRSES